MNLCVMVDDLTLDLHTESKKQGNNLQHDQEHELLYSLPTIVRDALFIST